MRPAENPQALVRRLYLALWIPLLVAYAIVFKLLGFTLGKAVLGSALNVAPPALLSLAVPPLCARWSWERLGRVRFLATHFGAALGFAAASTAGIVLLFTIEGLLDGSRIGPSTYDRTVLTWQAFISFLAYFALPGIHYAVSGALRLSEARALEAQMELRALRAQLNPHFLFNTLQSVLTLVRTDPDSAERALERFGDLLRYALRVQREGADEVPLAQEWAFVEDYLALEKLRLDERLRLRLAKDPEALACRVPVFCLQPLVENAVRHGVAPRAEGAAVTVAAERRDGRLLLLVEDDGPGVDPAAPPREGGLGLGIVRRRLANLYGPDASVAVVTAPGRGFRVRIDMPARPAGVDAPEAAGA
jgi:signal transduction histidine kinase